MWCPGDPICQDEGTEPDKENAMKKYQGFICTPPLFYQLIIALNCVKCFKIRTTNNLGQTVN